MIIHFVCTGNSYRSRLAEAYLNSKELKNIKVISSGIKADKIISWIALRIIQKNNLTSYFSLTCNQTTESLIKKADFTVFMEEKHYDFCKNLGFSSKNFEVWNIYDLSPEMTETEKIEKSDETFAEIKRRVDKLLSKFSFTGRVE